MICKPTAKSDCKVSIEVRSDFLCISSYIIYALPSVKAYPHKGPTCWSVVCIDRFLQSDIHEQHLQMV